MVLGENWCAGKRAEQNHIKRWIHEIKSTWIKLKNLWYFVRKWMFLFPPPRPPPLSKKRTVQTKTKYNSKNSLSFDDTHILLCETPTSQQNHYFITIFSIVISTLSQWAHISQTITTTTKHNYVFFRPVRHSFRLKINNRIAFFLNNNNNVMKIQCNNDLIKSPPPLSQRNSGLKRKLNIVLCMKKSKEKKLFLYWRNSLKGIN